MDNFLISFRTDKIFSRTACWWQLTLVLLERIIRKLKMCLQKIKICHLSLPKKKKFQLIFETMPLGIPMDTHECRTLDYFSPHLSACSCGSWRIRIAEHGKSITRTNGEILKGTAPTSPRGFYLFFYQSVTPQDGESFSSHPPATAYTFTKSENRVSYLHMTVCACKYEKFVLSMELDHNNSL